MVGTDINKALTPTIAVRHKRILVKLERGYKSRRHEMADQRHPPSQIYVTIATATAAKVCTINFIQARVW